MKKVLTLGMSLVLLLNVCVPGTLANQIDSLPTMVSAETEHTQVESSSGEATTENIEETTEPETTEPETSESETTEPETTEPETTQPETTEPETTEPETTEPETTEPETSEPETTQPETTEPETTEPQCTCTPVDGVHDETCPLYEKPGAMEESVHIEGCYDGCNVDGCTCPCHEPGLFEQLMACENLLELYTLAEATPEAELLKLTDEENAQIEAKIESLKPESVPSVENALPEISMDEPVISEIIYPTVNFDNVAPFRAPVAG